MRPSLAPAMATAYGRIGNGKERKFWKKNNRTSPERLKLISKFRAFIKHEISIKINIFSIIIKIEFDGTVFVIFCNLVF